MEEKWTNEIWAHVETIGVQQCKVDLMVVGSWVFRNILRYAGNLKFDASSSWKFQNLKFDWINFKWVLKKIFCSNLNLILKKFVFNGFRTQYFGNKILYSFFNSNRVDPTDYQIPWTTFGQTSLSFKIPRDRSHCESPSRSFQLNNLSLFSIRAVISLLKYFWRELNRAFSEILLGHGRLGSVDCSDGREIENRAEHLLDASSSSWKKVLWSLALSCSNKSFVMMLIVMAEKEIFIFFRGGLETKGKRARKITNHARERHASGFGQHSVGLNEIFLSRSGGKFHSGPFAIKLLISEMPLKHSSARQLQGEFFKFISYFHQAERQSRSIQAREEKLLLKEKFFCCVITIGGLSRDDR